MPFTFNPFTGTLDAVKDTSGFQPLDATLTALAGLSTSADQMIYSTGSDAFSMTSLNSSVRTWLGTPSSANLASAITDETGSGALTFATSPTFTTQITTPVIYGGNSGTSTLFLGGDDGTPFTGTAATGGRVTIDDPITLLSTSRTFTAATGNLISVAGTYTIDFAAGSIGQGFSMSPTVQFNQAPGAAMGTVFNLAGTWTNVASSGVTTLANVFAFISQPVIGPTTDNLTLSIHQPFMERTQFKRIAGTPTMTVTDWNQYTATNSAGVGGSVPAGMTITNRRGLLIGNLVGTGTLTNQYGIDINALTKGATLNVGIRNVPELRQVGVAMFGADSTATALVHMAAGTATASTAPLKFTSGTNLTVAEAGAMEYDATTLWFTNGGAQRQELPQMQQSRASAQFDKTNNTLANVTGLTATLVAGKFYRFEAVLYTTSNVAAGVQFAIAGTATATAIIYEAIVDNAAVEAAQTRAAALATAVGGVTAVTVAYVRITGTIQVNAAGTLTVQFAQNVTNAAASSVLVGSHFEVIQMV